MKRIICLIITLLLLFAEGSSANSLLEQSALASPGDSTSDWSAIALLVSDKAFDKKAYLDALKDYVAEKYQQNGKLSPVKSTEWHRIALAVTLCGEDATNFYGINLINDGVFFRENLGRQGINAYIWSLIAINSGNYAEEAGSINTIEAIISHILSVQNADGSFSLRTNEPDCDITAMTICALSSYKSREDVSHAIENAINFLSLYQNDDGSFSQNNIPNAESTAQVMIALASIGISPKTDVRFQNLYDSLLSFRTADGFSHIYNSSTNIIATYQAECALVAADKCAPIYRISKTVAKEIPIEFYTESYTEPPKEINTQPVPIVENWAEEETSALCAEEITEPKTTSELIEPSEGNTQAPTEDESTFSVNPTESENKSKSWTLSVIIMSVIIVFICIYVIMRKKHEK